MPSPVSVSGAALGDLWAGNIYGTNTGKIFLELTGPPENLVGVLRLADDQFGLAVLSVTGSFSQDTLALTGTVKEAPEDVVLGDVSAVGKLQQNGSLSGEWKSTIGTGGVFQLKAELKSKEASVIRELLQSLGLGIGFVLVTDLGHFWFSVKKEYLSLYDLDVPLKFPAHISGTWNVLGVVDALPNDHVAGLQEVIEKNIDGLLPPMVFHMLQLVGAQAAMFGRPLTAHGLSPLVVFREIVSPLR